MAVMVRTCCCGCDLKTGILLIAILGLLSSGYGIYSGFHDAKILNHFKDDVKERVDSPISYKYYQVVINLDYAKIGFCVVYLLIYSLLLESIARRNRFMALPYIFFQIFMLVYTLGVTIFLISIWRGRFSSVFVENILGWLLSIYFTIVVYSYHESLREDPSGASAGFVAEMRGPAMVQVAGPPPYAKFP